MRYTFSGRLDSQGVPLSLSPYVPHLALLFCLRCDVESLKEKAAELGAAADWAEYDLMNATEGLAEVDWTPDPSAYDYWRRPDTGQVYGLRFLEERITGCVGPLTGTLYADNLAGFRYEDAANLPLIAWAERHREEFVVVPEVQIEPGNGTDDEPILEVTRELAERVKAKRAEAAIDTVLVRSFFRALARDPNALAHLDEAAAE